MATGIQKLSNALIRRFGNPRSWSGVDRAIAISVTSLPWITGYCITLAYLLEYRDVAPFLHWPVVTLFFKGLLTLCIAWWALLAVSLRVRTSQPENRWIIHATVQANVQSNVIAMLLLGPLTSPYGIVPVGAVMVSLILFDFKVVFSTVAVSVGLIVAASLAQANGVFAYAPMLQYPPYDGAELDWWWRNEMALVIVINSVLLFSVVAYIVARMRDDGRKLEEMSRTDALTGLYNRRHMDDVIAAEFDRAQRHTKPLVCLMIDLDHFKTINDKYGHAVGDTVLRAIAQLFRESMRTHDMVARYGGEEFLLLLPETDLAGAEIVAERMRTLIESHPVSTKATSISVTASFGLAAYPNPNITSADTLVRLADEALYLAKRSGRNRIGITVPAPDDTLH